MCVRFPAVLPTALICPSCPVLVAGIHALKSSRNIKDVDGRDKPGHDDGEH